MCISPFVVAGVAEQLVEKDVLLNVYNNHPTGAVPRIGASDFKPTNAIQGRGVVFRNHNFLS
jgi:hypothetical protein